MHGGECLRKDEKMCTILHNSSRRPLFESSSMQKKRDASPVMLALPAFSYPALVKYEKTALSVEQQRLLLCSRGLKINSEKLLEKLLRDYGYARLDAYCDAFVIKDSRTFRKSTSLSQISQVIALDEQLRNLLFPYLLRIEMAVKAGFVEVLANREGPMAYMKSELFHDQALHVRLLAHASDCWPRSSDLQSITFRKRYDETRMPPIWYLSQTLPFGSLSKWIGNLKTPIQQELMNELGLPSHRLFANSGLLGLTVLRNFCAHGARIWNCVFPISFDVDVAVPSEYNSRRLASAMSLVELCLDRLKLNSEKFALQRSTVLATVPKWQIQRMGYPVHGRVFAATPKQA